MSVSVSGWQVPNTFWHQDYWLLSLVPCFWFCVAYLVWGQGDLESWTRKTRTCAFLQTNLLNESAHSCTPQHSKHSWIPSSHSITSSSDLGLARNLISDRFLWTHLLVKNGCQLMGWGHSYSFTTTSEAWYMMAKGYHDTPSTLGYQPVILLWQWPL